MAIVKYRPITPSRRFMTNVSFDELSKVPPLKSLTEPLRKSGGRNNQGRITSRWIGGGHKQRYRRIDFLRRDKEGIPGTVATIEYDPNRSTRIALVVYKDGEKRYILHPLGLKIGTEIMAGEKAEIRPGNALMLKNIPLGTMVHNLELTAGRGGQMVRAAGSAAQLMAREAKYANLRLPSGEIRKVREECYATIGQLSNTDHENITVGKAGKSRWLGKNPRVRGTVMNPVDHPHGGGEGKTKGGRHPVTPWGVPTKGHKTRSNKSSSKFIVQRRRKKR